MYRVFCSYAMTLKTAWYSPTHLGLTEYIAADICACIYVYIPKHSNTKAPENDTKPFNYKQSILLQVNVQENNAMVNKPERATILYWLTVGRYTTVLLTNKE